MFPENIVSSQKAEAGLIQNLIRRVTQLFLSGAFEGHKRNTPVFWPCSLPTVTLVLLVEAGVDLGSTVGCLNATAWQVWGRSGSFRPLYKEIGQEHLSFYLAWPQKRGVREGGREWEREGGRRNTFLEIWIGSCDKRGLHLPWVSCSFWPEAWSTMNYGHIL